MHHNPTEMSALGGGRCCRAAKTCSKMHTQSAQIQTSHTGPQKGLTLQHWENAGLLCLHDWSDSPSPLCSTWPLMRFYKDVELGHEFLAGVLGHC